MKQLGIIFLFVMSFLSIKAQAHLGSTEYQIKKMYPNNTFTVDYTLKSHIRYISTDFQYGNFTYYFDAETGLSKFCFQIPHSTGTMNAQVEIYNKKYVIISDTSWKAYLEGGGIMYINLVYDSENKNSYFT